PPLSFFFTQAAAAPPLHRPLPCKRLPEPLGPSPLTTLLTPASPCRCICHRTGRTLPLITNNLCVFSVLNNTVPLIDMSSSAANASSTSAVISTYVSTVKSDFHPTLAVTNIKHGIPFVLELEKDHYDMWAELFEIHARAHKVIDHIISQPGKENPASTDADFEMWTILDSTVLQWIYSTISFDLLTTIMEKGSTVMAAWNRLANIF
ncbi:hypothetical protein A2U01_0005837, partial [Trifolium medium]|nr:hypothetical protein [Trifolium medium]